MSFLSFSGSRRRVGRDGLTAVAIVATALAWTAVFVWSIQSETWAQGIDCERLRAMLSQPDRGGGSGAKARQQASELARTRAYAHQLGCDSKGFLFFGGGGDNPQCPGINARISQMEANLGRLQGGGGRDDLLARYNASCRGGQPRERGFFESIFGGPETAPPPTDLPPDETAEPGDGARGGSQAVCVRTCDGGFFPLPISSRHSADSLTELCSALCPGTQSAVYTRGPNSEIKTALGLDGKPYMDMPNALKFQKAYSPTCSCRPAGKTWAEALANAEEVLGSQRKGDILVTPEKSDEMSRPKMSPEIRGALIESPGPTKVSPEEASKLTSTAQSANAPTLVTGPDGVKRLVRRVGPQP